MTTKRAGDDTNDARLSTGLAGHPKTKKLIRRAGEAGAWNLVCLILWARDNRPDGDLTGMTGEDIELAVDWRGEPDAFVRALVDVGFLDGRESAYQLHDWADHQPWATGADLRSLKARWNAVKRHHGKAEADRQVPEWAAHVRATSNAASTGSDAGSNAHSNAAAPENTRSSNAPSPSPFPSPKQEQELPLSPPEGGATPKRRKRSKAPEITLAAHIADCEARGVDPIPKTDAVWRRARDAGLPDGWVALAWWAFQGRYLANPGDKAKTYASWPQAFRNAVSENWLKLWWPVDGGGYRLSPAGQQAQREMENAA